MDVLHQAFLDSQIKNNQLSRVELELDLQILSAAKAMEFDMLETWDPYGNKDILKAIRESRFLESSVILFDLDGLDGAPDGYRKRFGTLALVDEARSNFADAIIGMPQYFIRPGDKEATHVFMWDVSPKLEISVPNEIVEPVVCSRHAKNDEATESRYESLNYRIWYLKRKEEIAMPFLEYATQNGPAQVEKGTSWIADRIAEEIGKGNVDGKAEYDSPLRETMAYLNDIDELGWLGNADYKQAEKVLLQIAARSKAN